MTYDATTLIKEFEGCRLTAYQDEGGRWTIGWGYTDPGFIGPGTTWTQQEADDQLQADVQRVENNVQQLFSQQLTPNQLAALTSFTYNVGLGNFKRSGVYRFARLGQWTTAAQHMLLWNKVGMYVSPGLTQRRQQESAVLLST